MPTIRQCLQAAIVLLQNSTDSPQLDAELLLMHCIQQQRSYLYCYPEQAISSEQNEQFQDLVKARLAGQPIAYLLAEKEFWSLALQVDPNCLIPRPETELLVDICLQGLSLEPCGRILELGTGSGAIACALAKELPDWDVWAVEKNPATLAMAKRNAKRLDLQRIQFLQSDWFSAVPVQPFAAIVSNPPYLAEDDPHLQQGDLRFEPRGALVSREAGLGDLQQILREAPAFLAAGGFLLLEHGALQAEALGRYAERLGYAQSQCHQDLQGLDRVSQFWPHI